MEDWASPAPVENKNNYTYRHKRAPTTYYSLLEFLGNLVEATYDGKANREVSTLKKTGQTGQRVDFWPLFKLVLQTTQKIHKGGTSNLALTAVQPTSSFQNRTSPMRRQTDTKCFCRFSITGPSNPKTRRGGPPAESVHRWYKSSVNMSELPNSCQRSCQIRLLPEGITFTS